MLPSTFASASDRETKMRRTLKVKLEYAKFLQKTLDEMAPVSSAAGRTSKSAKDFVDFFQSVKQQGHLATNEDIIKFSKLFEDELTLDNMTRGQLVALCRLLELTPIGTNAFLKFQLEMKVRQLKTDDRVIRREGVDSLDVLELQTANKERGMRALGMPEERLKKQLEQWLDLSLNANIPPSLLLLSRTLYLPENVAPTAQIAASISALPDAAAAQTMAQIGEREGKIRNVVRLEQIKEEQKKIEEEEQERIKEEKRKEEEKKKQQQQQEIAVEYSEPVVGFIEEEQASVKRATVSEKGDVKEQEEVLVDRAPILEDSTAAEILSESSTTLPAGAAAAAAEAAQQQPAKASEEISSEDLSELKSAIESLGKAGGQSSSAAAVDEVEEITDLKRELADYEEDLEELAYMKAVSSRPDIHETPGARRLFGKVNAMLGKVDSLVSSLQEKERELEAQLKEDLSDDEKSTDAHSLVTVQELIDAVQRLQGSSDTSKVEQIAEVSTGRYYEGESREKRKRNGDKAFFTLFLF